MKLKVKKLHANAQLPVYGSEGAGCFDLHCCNFQGADLHPGEVTKVPTGLAFEIPEGHCMLLFSRSGHGAKGIRLANSVGVIDSDYRGDVGILMFNDGKEVKSIAPGERVAQAMIIPVPSCSFEEVDELSDTVRGEGGFGSTGK